MLLLIQLFMIGFFEKETTVAINLDSALRGVNIHSLGKGSCCGKKYLAFDASKGWSVKRLNWFQCLLRFIFGCYRETHLSTIKRQIKNETGAIPVALLRRLKISWQNAHGSSGSSSSVSTPSGSLSSRLPVQLNAECCLQCTTRAKYVDPANNQKHPYCGRTCAQKAQARGFTFFYSSGVPTYNFTNFALTPFTYRGKQYQCVEEAFQTLKFEGTGYEAAVRQEIENNVRNGESLPRAAFNAARTFAAHIRPGWHAGLKDQVMYELVKEKFSQNPSLRDQLLATGDTILVEHTNKDNYWGDGADSNSPTPGVGGSMLGKILMVVRERP